jgi:methionyl-tRNA formyltransferase
LRIAILGRTKWLLDTARALMAGGHDIVAVVTARSEAFYGCGPEDFANLASAAGATDFGVASLADVEVRERLLACGAELAVSINWPTIVGADVIDVFPLGVVNAHCGDLPRYRGNACPNWAILNGEERIGLCAHMMEPDAVDAGAVILRDYFPVRPDTYIGDVYVWLDRRIPTLLFEAIEGLASGRLVPEPQPSDPVLALRCYPRRPEDGRVNWSADVTQIDRLVRASSRPFAGAFSTLDDGRPVTIWRASPFVFGAPFCAVPGQIMIRKDGDPVIACGAGALRLEEIEVDGVDFAEVKKFVGRSVRARLV